MTRDQLECVDELYSTAYEWIRDFDLRNDRGVRRITGGYKRMLKTIAVSTFFYLPADPFVLVPILDLMRLRAIMNHLTGCAYFETLASVAEVTFGGHHSRLDHLFVYRCVVNDEVDDRQVKAGLVMMMERMRIGS